MKRIIILTGSELRHKYFRKFIALQDGIIVLNCFCEGQEKSLRTIVEKDEALNDLRLKHLQAREQSEIDFFGQYDEVTEDESHPIFLPKGDINSPNYYDLIIQQNPDILIAYGCSIIKEPLLSTFTGRFLNVHLGLSPYYRGSGTNFWPLVNGEPEYVGATFMFINAGIDTGEIIHQIRANYTWGDTPSQIGNRLIVDMSKEYAKIIVGFDDLEKMPQLPVPIKERLYFKKHYTEESVQTLYRNFSDGLIEKYLLEEEARCAKAPIITNKALQKE